MEKQLSREEIYNGKVIRVAKDEVLIDDGSHAWREVVLHNGGACIALKKDGAYFMVNQYRYVLGKMMLEFPAGKIEIARAHIKRIEPFSYLRIRSGQSVRGQHRFALRTVLMHDL